MLTDLGFFQRVIRFYTFNTPIKKGKYRIASAGLGLKKHFPKQVVAKTFDGRTLKVNFDNHFAHYIYYLGEYEPAITELIKRIVKRGDICFDIGANIGWYTTFLQTLVGENGAVHSFEPVPPTFEILKENVENNRNEGVVTLNNLALGNTEGEVDLHVFDEMPDGHASISDFGLTEFKTYKSRISTLDSYLNEKQIDNVKFVKIDIEGAELMMLSGAANLFKQELPPIFEIEMALNTAKGFGYLPNDIIDFINAQREYDFYAIDEISGRLKKIESLKPAEIGANVLCIPKGFHVLTRNRIKDLVKG